MKLMRLGERGHERPAVLVSDDVALDVSDLVGDVDAALLSPEGLRSLDDAVAKRSGELPRIDPRGTRIGAPLARPGKVVCVGLNYHAHAAETGAKSPSEPILFMKAPDTVVGPDDVVSIPPSSSKTDYEVELAVVIGSTTRYLADKTAALASVAGYSISNDVSEREFQIERGGQWDKGKNCETFNPLGPWLVTADEVSDVQALRLATQVNGELRQDSTTADMIFPVDHLVWYVSQFMTLYPGDVINTGTPQGVGMGFKPTRYLNDEDVVQLTVEGLGTQRQTFRRYQLGR